MSLRSCGLLAEDDRELKRPALLKHFHRHAAAMPAHLDIDAGLVELQIAQHHLVQERRQAGVAQSERLPVEAKARSSVAPSEPPVVRESRTEPVRKMLVLERSDALPFA